MTIYIETCIISMLIAWFMPKIRFNNKPLDIKIQVLLTIVPLILLVGLRYGIGTDYFLYEHIFEQGNTARVVTDLKAPLYFNVYNLGLQSIGGDFATSVFIIAVIYFSLIFYRVFEYSPYPWLSVFLIFGMLYLFISMNVMRQSFAMAFLLFSLKYLEKGKYIIFLLCLIIAIGIHPACAIFIVVPILYKSKINLKLITIFTPIIFAVVYGAKNYIGIVAALFNFEQYLGGNEASGPVLIANFAWQAAVVIVGAYYYYKESFAINGNAFKIYFATQLIALWCYPMLLFINSNEFSRILWIFGLPNIIFTPMLIKNFKTPILKIVLVSIILVCFFVNMYMSIVVYHNHEVIPYMNIMDTLQ